MKRSEMLSIIRESINEVEDADHILKRLEAAGMLPPICPPGTTIVIGRDKYGNPAAFEIIRTYRSVWEQEDET